ncbi:hypothetical protein ACJX0J_027096, partial [Zea mays]
ILSDNLEISMLTNFAYTGLEDIMSAILNGNSNFLETSDSEIDKLYWTLNHAQKLRNQYN